MASSVGTGLSRVLGLARELALANVLGAGMVMDAFVMAFTFPGMVRRFVADEGLTGALVPAIAKAEAEDGTVAAQQLAGRVLVALFIAVVTLSVAGVFAAPVLVDWVADGFGGEKRALTIALTRILFPFVIFVSLVSWCEGLLNHRDHFFVPKLAPGLVSAAMVVAALWPHGGDPIATVWAVSWAVLVGGAAHLLVCVPPLVKHWGVIRPRFDAFVDPRFRSVMTEMGKVAVIGIMAQANIIVLRYIASHLTEGAVTWYWNATRLVDFAQGIIAVGIGSAMLPAISRAVAAHDGPGFQKAFSGATILAASLLIPAAAFVGILATPIVAVLYRHGAYTWEDVRQTADALQVLVPYMLALAGIQIVKKPFFALERRGALIGVGAIGVVCTAALGLWLAPISGVQGLAAALSISTVIQFGLYLLLLGRFVDGQIDWPDIRAKVLRITHATLYAGLIGFGFTFLAEWSEGPSLVNIAVLASAAIMGGSVYLFAASRLGITEVNDILSRLKRRIKRD
jgi:putative peptidoglycan lipid II flippase